MSKKIIEIHNFEDRLKRKIRKHFKSLGYTVNNNELVPPILTKENIRKLHSKQKNEKLIKNKKLLNRIKPEIYNYFADGTDICPEKIKPRLEIVRASTKEADLFRLAGLTWSVPVSEGYGRRIRFLVWDDYNGKLMGLLAITDPSIGSGPRERFIGWDKKTKDKNLVYLMDAHIVGAIAPYNQILCGKLIACLLKTREIKDIFNKKYKNKVGYISEIKKNPKLVLITTTSSLGRSSVYNRLKIQKEEFMIPLKDIDTNENAYTDGWGHFHFSEEILKDFDELLRKNEHKYYKAYKFKKGPNYKKRKIRASLKLLNLPQKYLRHGIKRQIFITHIANNFLEILNNKKKRPDYLNLKSVKEVSKMALERWVIKRANSDQSYKTWKKSNIKKLIFNEINYLDLPLFQKK